MADIQSLKIQKKDGTSDIYDRSKLLASITSAGASPEQAEQIADSVEAWATGLGAESVMSVDLRMKVLELLRPVNSVAAQAYESYVKPAAV